MANKSIVSQIFCSLTIAISNHFPYIHSGKHLHPLFSFHCCNLSRCHLEIDFGWINNLQNFKQKNKFDFPFLILSTVENKYFCYQNRIDITFVKINGKIGCKIRVFTDRIQIFHVTAVVRHPVPSRSRFIYIFLQNYAIQIVRRLPEIYGLPKFCVHQSKIFLFV